MAVGARALAQRGEEYENPKACAWRSHVKMYVGEARWITKCQRGEMSMALSVLIIQSSTVKRVRAGILYVLASVGACFLVLLLLLGIYRTELSEFALHSALQTYGVTVKGLQVKEVGLKGVSLGSTDLLWRGQEVGVQHISLERVDSEKAGSFGALRVEGLDCALNLEAWQKAVLQEGQQDQATTVVEKSSEPLPAFAFSSLSVDGVLRLGLPGADKVFELSMHAVPDASAEHLTGSWSLKAEQFGSLGSYTGSVDGEEGHISIRKFDTSLSELKSVLALVFPDAVEGWALEGTISATAELEQNAAGLAGSGRVVLSASSVVNSELGLEAAGLELRLVLDEIGELRSGVGQTLSIKTLKISEVVLEDVQLRFQLLGPELMVVESLTGRALGGRISIQPMRLNPAGPTWAGTVELSGVDASQVMQYLPEARATVEARIDGLIPLSYGPVGMRFGRGWLSLSEGTEGRMKLDQPGLLTGGMDTKGTAYPVLKSLEDGILNLRLKTLRAELYAVESGMDRSVSVTISGEALDPKIKAPVELELNVNGPLGPLIDWGMDSRISAGIKQ